MRGTQGYGRLGGIGAAEAADLHARSGAAGAFAAAWRLADRDGDGRLCGAEFCLFMYLLKATRRGWCERLLTYQVHVTFLRQVVHVHVPAKAARRGWCERTFHQNTGMSSLSTEQAATSCLFLHKGRPAWLVRTPTHMCCIKV